ncbi:MAG: mycothiol transferase [Actinomycetes bacterium]
MGVASELLVDAFGRVHESVHEVMEGLAREVLVGRLDAEANTIAWLVWHLSRVADDHVAGVAGTEQVWLTDGWVERFGLPFAAHEHGYGHSSEQVAAVDVDGQLLLDYADAVHHRVVAYLRDLDDAELPRIVDRRWDPPVTLAVRLVSVVNDATQHIGQAAFIRGVLERTRD